MTTTATAPTTATTDARLGRASQRRPGPPGHAGRARLASRRTPGSSTSTSSLPPSWRSPTPTTSWRPSAGPRPRRRPSAAQPPATRPGPRSTAPCCCAPVPSAASRSTPARAHGPVGAGVKWGELCAALDDTGLIGPGRQQPRPQRGRPAARRRRQLVHPRPRLHREQRGLRRPRRPRGELVHVTRASDPELFWALRGGGGDFGIVVRVEIALFPAPELYGGQLLWPVEHAPAVLRAFRDLSLVAPRELTHVGARAALPADWTCPEPMRGRVVRERGGDVPRLGQDGRDPALVAA